jgi:hypothetical protein
MVLHPLVQWGRLFVAARLAGDDLDHAILADLDSSDANTSLTRGNGCGPQVALSEI